MSSLGKLVGKLFMLLIVLGFVVVIGKGLLCSRPGDLLSFLPDITAPDSPTSVTIIKGGVPIPKDSILINVPESAREGLVLPDTVYLPVEITAVVTEDTVLIAAKVAGVSVQLKEVTYIRQTSPWERWRFTLSAIPYDRLDFSAGVAYRMFRWGRWWLGPGLTADVPDFGWFGGELRAGRYFSPRASVDAALGYSTDRQVYFSVGASFSF